MVLYPYKKSESVQQSSDADKIKDLLFPMHSKTPLERHMIMLL